VTVSTAGGALSLAHGAADLTAADYDAITFDVRAPSSSSVRLALETLAGGASGASATIPVTTTWTRQTVKLTALQGSLAKFGKIDWIGAQSGQTFYVDNVLLVPKTAAATPPPPPPPPSSTFPSAPLTVTKSNVVGLSSSLGPYSLYVPSSYDATHRTPTKVLLWLHGCGGNAYGDAWAISPGGTQSWVSVSVGGRDGACWNVGTDVPLALAALDDVKRRLNVDPRRVVIGGYSSGGDMAYRTAFYNAKRFAGLIAENTTPFGDTGSSQTSSIAAAGWKLNVAQLAHVSDTTYPITQVRNETDALRNAGFPMTRIERPGTHWDPDTTSSGTNYDLRTYLLRYVDAGWVAP
jgi:pimeloyl-ACP methyl ester carboxylesterase